jgi:osmoprotectant transport system substrate-binding protein
MGNRFPIFRCVAIALVLAMGACSSGDGPARPVTSSALDDDSITVGSFNFAESELLAEIYGQALERGGYRVERAFHLGPREFVGPALARGLVELVPEYAGTAVRFFSVGSETPGADAVATHKTLSNVLKAHGLVALAAAPAQDANAFAVTRETAERYGLHDVSDLARVGPELVFGGPPECPSRPLCLVGLQKDYGVRFGDVVSTLDTGGPVRQALQENLIDVGLVFTTDPPSDELVELNDDRRLQPAENVTPVVRSEVVDRWGPKLVDLIDGVSARLTTAVLRQLNAEVANGASSRSVAAGWLDAQEGS